MCPRQALVPQGPMLGSYWHPGSTVGSHRSSPQRAEAGWSPAEAQGSPGRARACGDSISSAAMGPLQLRQGWTPACGVTPHIFQAVPVQHCSGQGRARGMRGLRREPASNAQVLPRAGVVSLAPHVCSGSRELVL